MNARIKSLPRHLELRNTIASVLLFMVVVTASVFTFLGISGCVQHKVTAPQLDTAIASIKKIAEKPMECAKLDKLPPIPQDVVIDIKGDKWTANPGGEQLLRYYVVAYKFFSGCALKCEMSGELVFDYPQNISMKASEEDSGAMIGMNCAYHWIQK